MGLASSAVRMLLFLAGETGSDAIPVLPRVQRHCLLRFSDESSRPLFRIWRLALSRCVAAGIGRNYRTISAIPRAATPAQSCNVAGTRADCHGMPTSFRMDDGGLSDSFLAVVGSKGSGST